MQHICLDHAKQHRERVLGEYLSIHTPIKEPMKKSLVMLLVVCGLQGCSGKPSSSDVEEALESEYSDCPNLAVEDFELINGKSIDESTHLVEVQFDLRVIPLPEDVIAARDAWQAEDDQRQALIDGEIAKMKELQSDLYQERNHLDDQEVAQLNSLGELSQAQWVVEKKKLEEQHGVPQINADIATLDEEIKAKDKSRYEHPVPPPKASWGSQACQWKSGVKIIGYPNAMKEAIENGEVNSFHLTFQMVKTDRGWMKAR